MKKIDLTKLRNAVRLKPNILLVECFRNRAARETLVTTANLSMNGTEMFVGILAQLTSAIA